MMRTFIKDTRAATLPEFALIASLFILFLLGIIDAARFAWTMNQAQKASQAAVRHAVVTNYVASGIEDFKFTDIGYTGGWPIVREDVTGTVTCDHSECSGALTVAGGDTIPIGYDSDAFSAIVERARASFPQLTEEQLEIEYEHVGIGYAGNPNGSDISPLVIARVKDVTFQPSILFGLAITLPTVEASMLMEDGIGAESYSA